MTDKITIERETLERQRFETWALLNHSMRDQEWFTESANDGTLADDLTDSWAAWRAALAAQPADAQQEPAAWGAALNTLAAMLHSGEEVEGDDGAAMMVDMALWNEGCEAFESLIGEEDNAAPPAPAALAENQPRSGVVCHASGDRCRGCDHYNGHTPRCEFAPAAMPLTDEQILQIAEPFGCFQYGDAQGHVRIEFARAVLAAAGE